MQINKKLLFIDELIAYAQEIENAVPRDAKNSNDENFFIYHLLHRMVHFAEAIVVLAERDFFHEIVLLARVEIEGLAYFMAYMGGVLDVEKGDAALASKWRAAMRYEAYLRELERNEQAGATRLLNEYENTLNAQSFSLIKKLVDGGRKKFHSQKWHGHGNVHQVFSLLKDKSAEDYYDIIYPRFSEVVHWSPSGVIGEKLDNYTEAALNSTFHCLCDMTKYVNKIYSLKGFDYKLKDVYSRYVSTMREEGTI